MIDKETIVDGIQVRECGHYWNGTCLAYTDNTGKYLLCINSPNCYYKQLKRKEQELKNICKAFDIEYAIDEETENLIGRCNKLYKKEQECEIWKNQVLTIDNETITVQITQRQFEEYNQLKAENEELKNCLTEIKELANYSFNRPTSEYMAKLELISERISEVENDKM